MHHDRSPFILVTIICLAALTGCSTDDDDDPMAPPGGSSGATSLYDGTWTTDLATFDYPVRGLRFTVQEGAFVHASLDSFWDLDQCPPPTYTNVRFNPASPINVTNGSFSTTQPMVTSPQTVEDLQVTFTSPGTATGLVVLSLDAGGPCVSTPMLQPFTATKN